MELDTVLHQDSLPTLAAMPDASIDAVITDPPYPNGSGLFGESLIDGIAGLYLAAKKASIETPFRSLRTANVSRSLCGLQSATLQRSPMASITLAYGSLKFAIIGRPVANGNAGENHSHLSMPAFSSAVRYD